MVFSMFSALLLTETAARSIANERRQDTWPWLRLTLLSRREVVRANVLGALWRLRGVLAVMAGLWLIGLAAGAVHPPGFLAALAVLIVTTGLIAVLGTTLSLWSRDESESRLSPLVVPVVVILTFSGLLPRVLPLESSSVVLGAASAPLLFWLVFVSWSDVAEGVRSGTFAQLLLLGIETGEGAWRVVVTCVIGLGVQAVAAALLFFAAVRTFDAQTRAPGPPPTKVDV